VILAACGEEKVTVHLLTIGDAVYDLADFEQYLQYSRPAMNPPFETDILRQYLEEYLEHRLLLKAATDNQIVAPSGVGRFERELSMIGQYLYQEAYIDIELSEDAIQMEYEERYKEPRVRIKSIFFYDERTARNEFNRLRRRPRDFDDLMERYNPDEMKNADMGQGVFTTHQLPERVRDVVFSVDKPSIVGPIDVDYGYMVVQVEEFLDRPSLEEVRYEIEDHLAARERFVKRMELVELLKKDYSIEFHPEIALGSEDLAISDNKGDTK
jgi:hypothetical protein